MKLLSRLAFAAVAVLASATLAAAQARSGLVNKLELQKLVAAGTPQANTTLAHHFVALADGYTADAAEHKAMARAYGANSNRAAVTGAARHCQRLATLATESAATAREMANYHAQLASGADATAPRNAAKFHGGEGARAPTAVDLHHLAMTARTPADHHSLEEYFATVAKRNTADAESHVAMAQVYRMSARKGSVDPASHCDLLVKLARAAATEATAAATLHRQLANVG